MKINELQPNSRADLIAKVKEISEVKQVNTKFGTTLSLTTAIIEDDTGSVKLNLWGSQSEGIEEASVVEIKNGFVKEFKGEMQISVGKMGSIKIIE